MKQRITIALNPCTHEAELQISCFDTSGVTCILQSCRPLVWRSARGQSFLLPVLSGAPQWGSPLARLSPAHMTVWCILHRPISSLKHECSSMLLRRQIQTTHKPMATHDGCSRCSLMRRRGAVVSQAAADAAAGGKDDVKGAMLEPSVANNPVVSTQLTRSAAVGEARVYVCWAGSVPPVGQKARLQVEGIGDRQEGFSRGSRPDVQSALVLCPSSQSLHFSLLHWTASAAASALHRPSGRCHAP